MKIAQLTSEDISDIKKKHSNLFALLDLMFEINFINRNDP